MKKYYYVVGATWSANVELEHLDHFTEETIKTEACSRAVEAWFNQMSNGALYAETPDVTIAGDPWLAVDEFEYNTSPNLESDASEEDIISDIMLELMQTELVSECGIGAVMSITERPYAEEECLVYVYYICSKIILENIGMANLVAEYNKQYPDPVAILNKKYAARKKKK